MNRHQSLRVRLVDQQRRSMRLAGVFLTIEFFTKGQRRYGFRVGPTDEEGEVRVDYDQLESQREKSASFQLMDYNTPLEECDSEMRVEIPTLDELKRAYEVVRSFRLADAELAAKQWLGGSNDAIAPCSSEFSLVPKGETVVELKCSFN